MNERDLLKRALLLAAKGEGFVSPNPMVGAIIVSGEGEVLGEGYHQAYGGPHAEVWAVQDAEAKGGKGVCAGATLYCTLEPCSHTKKQTPPCTDLIIQKGFKRVVVATSDPNPAVDGNGLRILQAQGIETKVCDDLEIIKAAKELNQNFFKCMTTGLPWIHLKWAQSLDGRLATSTGDAKWISSPGSRERTHDMRSHCDAIMVGVDTLLSDNPELTVRYGKLLNQERPPFRIIVGWSDKITFKERVFIDDCRHRTILCIPDDVECTTPLPPENIIRIKRDDLHDLLKKLVAAPLKITSLFVEGGPTLLTSFLQQKLYDKVSIFIAPKIIGGDGLAIGPLGISKMSEVLDFKEEEGYHFEQLPNNSDILFTK
ncbi:MAG: bifunctional diaminohydroxyphosphoribosylaminopyrimidine deaminase/5-amino-6-(5-phosphoribosylamino)uracil reductase RibD [Oligoflexia bacterium]|nr:bifunctional diaminohydroxyphosphoribosylaminopyrimidine deaminase/5-amino-6-(5-phosphoribosylamino)uracil reductase RibD [Oligoflexia bacterium]